MATESPMRMVESVAGRKWPSFNDGTIFGSPLKDMAAEELGLLLKGHAFHGDQTDLIPSRSGSAPPSMEGSFAAISNLIARQKFSTGSTLESLGSAIENCESEEQLRSDPAYFAYYCSNVNMNPRLPPPLMSRENRRLVRHIGGFGNNRRPSVDDSGYGSLQLSQGSLSTHKEEPEDDTSLTEASEYSSLFMSGQNRTTLTGRHKSLVDLIQADFPRTPSPVYSQSRSSSYAAEEAIDHDVHAISSNASAINISKASESNCCSDVCVDTYALEVDAIRLISNDDASTSTFPTSPSCDGTPTQQKNESNTKDFGFDAHSPSRDCLQSGMSTVVSKMKNKEEQQSFGQNVLQSDPSKKHGILPPSQVISQAMIHSHIGVGDFSHGHPKPSAIEAQLPFQPSALNLPLYASAAAYVTSGAPFYPSFQQSGFYTPQYGVGGYPLGSTFLPPYMSSYSSQVPIPLPFGSSSGPTIDGQRAAAPAEEGHRHASTLQHLSKLYGQRGLLPQPSFMDPLHMQYFHHPFGHGYGNTLQQNRLASTGIAGSQIDPFSAWKDPMMSYMGDQRLQPPTNGSPGIPFLGEMGITGGGCYGAPSSMGVTTQFPAPLNSPILPSSPVGRINHASGRHDLRFPQCSNRGLYSGDQGQRGLSTVDDSKRHFILEELKTSNAQKFELSDIAGRIVEFSIDQHGSRFIQQKLEHCSADEKECVFKEVLPHASKLMTDVFGNYVVQKFFEHGGPEQQKKLAEKLAGQMLQLSLQMYGCRVIQKALEVIELDQKIKLVKELDGHVIRCVHDQNGNHVIQKCIECVPAECIEFIISAFQGQVVALSTHPYGCRVIQRVLEHCFDEKQSQCIVDEILESAYFLAQDQYGNYVTQHVLGRGKSQERSQIISTLRGKIVQMSQHKYASNVIEKCLEHADAAERELLIEEILGEPGENDDLLAMMKDQFANYVVQKILEISGDKQQERLLDRIRVHINALKKYTYGKHIVARFEQLCGAENQASEA